MNRELSATDLSEGYYFKGGPLSRDYIAVTNTPANSTPLLLVESDDSTVVMTSYDSSSSGYSLQFKLPLKKREQFPVASKRNEACYMEDCVWR